MGEKRKRLIILLSTISLGEILAYSAGKFFIVQNCSDI